MDNEGSYNFAFPEFRFGTGVTPAEDKFAFARLLASQMPTGPVFETAPPPSQKQAPPTSLMQGTGFDEENETDSEVEPSSLNAVKDSDKKLTPGEKVALKAKIEQAKATMSDGKLIVKSFETGKQKANAESSDQDEALEEVGYGKRKKKSSKVRHCLKFE